MEDIIYIGPCFMFVLHPLVDYGGKGGVFSIFTPPPQHTLSDWPGLCLFCCFQPSCTNKVDFGLFLFQKCLILLLHRNFLYPTGAIRDLLLTPIGTAVKAITDSGTSHAVRGGRKLFWIFVQFSLRLTHIESDLHQSSESFNLK